MALEKIGRFSTSRLIRLLRPDAITGAASATNAIKKFNLPNNSGAIVQASQFLVGSSLGLKDNLSLSTRRQKIKTFVAPLL